MNPTEFDQYTEELQHALQSFDEVFGLVTLGSTADSQFRDQWSDHDFWVITKSSSQANFLDDLSWLPHSDHVLLKVRHSNGYTVVYDNKHKVEFAVFDFDEARNGKAERYAVLIDREGITELMRSIHVSTVKQSRTQAEALENLCVIVWSSCERYQRGEQLSARQYLDGFATNQLLSLVTSTSGRNRDQLDPGRRLEMSSPRFGNRGSHIARSADSERRPTSSGDCRARTSAERSIVSVGKGNVSSRLDSRNLI